MLHPEPYLCLCPLVWLYSFVFFWFLKKHHPLQFSTWKKDSNFKNLFPTVSLFKALNHAVEFTELYPALPRRNVLCVTSYRRGNETQTITNQMNLCGTISSLQTLVKYEWNKSALPFGGHWGITGLQLLLCYYTSHRATFRVPSNAELHLLHLLAKIAHFHGSKGFCLDSVNKDKYYLFCGCFVSVWVCFFPLL